MGRAADVIDLAPRRGAPVGRIPLAVQSEPDAVALFLPGFEFWLTPEQSDELAANLRAGAAAARAQRPRPRGA